MKLHIQPELDLWLVGMVTNAVHGYAGDCEPRLRRAGRPRAAGCDYDVFSNVGRVVSRLRLNLGDIDVAIVNEELDPFHEVKSSLDALVEIRFDGMVCLRVYKR